MKSIVRRFALLLALLPVLAHAQVGERERLAAERETLTQRYAAEERACRERFVVTSCVDDVRQRRRAALAPLRQRELQLADAERIARAQERQAARAARPQPLPSPVRPASAPRQDNAQPLRPAPLAGSAAPRAEAPRHRDEEGGRAVEAAQRVRAAAERASDVDQTRAEIARRQAERSARSKKSAPLAPPPAASAASR